MGARMLRSQQLPRICSHVTNPSFTVQAQVPSFSDMIRTGAMTAAGPAATTAEPGQAGSNSNGGKQPTSRKTSFDVGAAAATGGGTNTSTSESAAVPLQQRASAEAHGALGLPHPSISPRPSAGQLGIPGLGSVAGVGDGHQPLAPRQQRSISKRPSRLRLKALKEEGVQRSARSSPDLAKEQGHGRANGAGRHPNGPLPGMPSLGRRNLQMASNSVDSAGQGVQMVDAETILFRGLRIK